MQLFPLPTEEANNKLKVSLSPTISENKRTEHQSAEHSIMESSSFDTDPDGEPEVVSDSESGISGSTREEGGGSVLENGSIRVGEDDRIHQIITQKLLSGLGNLGNQITIESIHRNAFPGSTRKMKLQVFQMLANAVAKDRGDNANVRYAWFGASKDEINTIVSHGFVPYMIKDQSFGHGIYLSPDHFPLGSLKSAVADENGMRHLLLCRVILGRTEIVPRGSSQYHPSSQEFDSGVDDLDSPSKYIVWSTHMNTHILPQYVISFRVSPVVERNGLGVKKPTSPWISFPALISALAKYLPPQSMKLIAKFHKDHRERRMSRTEMIQNLRKVAGDELLAEIIKAHRTKNATGKERMNCACGNVQ